MVADEVISQRAQDYQQKIKVSHDYLDIYTKLADNASKGGAVQQ